MVITALTAAAVQKSNVLSPKYLKDCLHPYRSSQVLRLAEGALLVIPPSSIFKNRGPGEDLWAYV